MPRTGKFRIISGGDLRLWPKHYWTADKTWSPDPSRARVYNWEEKWATKEIPRDSIWEEIPWEG